MSHDPFHAFVDRAPDPRGGEGPLAGLTAGIKSNIAVAGLPWTAGMGLRRDIVAGRDAEVVARLRGAGAAILGTLNMHEAALGATTDNAFYGRTINPHRAGYTPGGSSGGSGAAVAAGLCDVALGTDTLGSIRIPAAYCGVYGLKPTLGAVPTDGFVFLDPRYDVIGPLARDLGTLEAAWQVIADRLGDASPLTRMVVLDDAALADAQPAVLDAYRTAGTAVALPETVLALPAPLEAIRLAAIAGIGRALAADLGPRVEDPGVSDELRFVIGATSGLPLNDALLAETRAALLAALGSDGVLLLPTAPQAAFPHTARPPASQPLYTSLASIAGLPALACPAGRDADGLPVGVQLVGPPGSEPALIDLARRIEPILGGFIAPPAQGE